MGKQSGLGDNLYVSGYDLSGDIGSLSSIRGGPSTLNVTGINKFGYERVGGQRSGSIEYSAFFNPSIGQAHARLSLLPTTDQILTYCRGTLLGSPAACLTSKQVNYDPDRSKDGDFKFGVQALSNGFGIEWGKQLTAGKRTDGGATNGTGVDHVASSAFGLQAYLQVFAFTGTDATIKIQESSDNGGGDAFTDVVGGAFTQVTTSPVFERIATAAITVERYLRVITTTVSGFSNLVFSVVVIKNDTEVIF